MREQYAAYFTDFLNKELELYGELKVTPTQKDLGSIAETLMDRLENKLNNKTTEWENDWKQKNSKSTEDIGIGPSLKTEPGI